MTAVFFYENQLSNSLQQIILSIIVSGCISIHALLMITRWRYQINTPITKALWFYLMPFHLMNSTGGKHLILPSNMTWNSYIFVQENAFQCHLENGGNFFLASMCLKHSLVYVAFIGNCIGIYQGYVRKITMKYQKYCTPAWFFSAVIIGNMHNITSWRAVNTSINQSKHRYLIPNNNGISCYQYHYVHPTEQTEILRFHWKSNAGLTTWYKYIIIGIQ